MIRRTAFLALLAVAASVTSADVVSDYVSQVSQATYTTYINDALYTRAGNSRKFSTGANRIAARDAIRNHFTSVGFQSSLESFTYSGQTGWNIVGVLPGRVTPEKVYLVGAHWDSANHNGGGSGANAGAPGADDNASGVAALMEMSRVLAGKPFDSTIAFVGFDAEEVGLIGAKRYVTAHASQNIRAAISMDMIAYNPNNQEHDLVNLYYKHTATGRSLANEVDASFDRFGGGVAGVPSLYTTYDLSDHTPFSDAGIPAALVTEYTWDNPRYHRWDDASNVANYLDLEYATRITRAMTGYIATAAGALQPGDADRDGDVDFDDLVSLAQHYGEETGATWTLGDFTGNAAVNFDDLVQLAQAYGTGTTTLTSSDFAADWALAAALVPEPAIALAGVSLLCLFRRVRTAAVVR